MNYFFMPRIPELRAAVTLCNFPPVDGWAAWPPDCVAHVMWSDGARWQVRDLGDLAAGTSHTFDEADLPGDCPADASPFYFFHPEKLPRTLAEPRLDLDMHTLPGWRGNIILRGPSTTTSYVGEYPKGMLKIDRGTLLSFATFQQSGGEVATRFVLPNLRMNPAIEACVVRFVSGRSRKVLKDVTCWRNRVTVAALDGIEVDPTDMVVAVSREITGVPLYLTHTRDFSEMSFEHTHPPVEYLVFGDRMQFQRQMKSWWITEAFK